MLIGNTSKEIPIIIATSMILYNKYGVDINYSIDNAIGKRLDSSDDMILLKDTLTSGNTLKDTLTQIEKIADVRIPYIIVSVDRMERGERAMLSASQVVEKEYNTLFDENASCHLALGRAYPMNVAGGTDMDQEQLTAAGANHSMTHVDFMFGSRDMHVDGMKKDATVIPVFSDGNFVF